MNTLYITDGPTTGLFMAGRHCPTIRVRGRKKTRRRAKNCIEMFIRGDKKSFFIIPNI
jgi:hypothetical protein